MCGPPVRTVILATPQLPLLVDASVFDGFAWNPSTVVEWRAPHASIVLNALDGELPLGLAFVFRQPWDALPSEFARLHLAKAYGLRDELCLAPYGIDDATDELFSHHRAAHDVFWMAADNLNALYWGLHDWAHFHNHGAFVERAANELQCDASALAWLWLNRSEIPLDESHWDSLRAQVHLAHVAHRTREPPTVPADPTILAERAKLIALAASLPADLIPRARARPLLPASPRETR